MKNKKVAVLIACIGIIVTASVYYSNKLLNDGDKNYIEASGIVEGQSVIVSSKISGQIEKIDISEGDIVKKGQKIGKVSSKNIEAKVKQAIAKVELANAQVKLSKSALKESEITVNQTELAVDLSKEEVESKIRHTESGLEMAKAKLKQSKVAYKDAESDYSKYKELYNNRGITLQQLEKSKLRLDTIKNEYEAAENQVIQAEAAIKLAKSSQLGTEIKEKISEATRKKIEQAQATFEASLAQQKFAQAVLEEVNSVLDDTIIKAPTSGRITFKLVNEGELINQGTPIIEIIDLSNLDLMVYVSEREIGKVKLGQSADIFIDSYQDKSFKGKVSYISDKAEFTPKNIHMKDDRVKLVYGVKIKLDNTYGIIKPGMPADSVINLN